MSTYRELVATGGVLPVVTLVVGIKIGTGGCRDAGGEPYISISSPETTGDRP